MDDRRTFLAKMAALAATTGLLSRPGTAAGPELNSAAERFLWRMLGGVEVGAPFHAKWYLLDAYPPVAGGVTLVIAKGDDGKPLRVDVVRRDGEPRAAAYTDHLELYTMDAGGGVRHMDPGLVEALQALAEVLQDNEAQWRLADSLLTHKERIARYPEFMARASKELAPSLP
jgi:hypothetical protein